MLSGNDHPCPEPSDCGKKRSSTPSDEESDDDSESIATSSGSIESWHSSCDQMISSKPVVGFLNMESLKDEETPGFWVLQG